jgi:hypothetical protein
MMEKLIHDHLARFQVIDTATGRPVEAAVARAGEAADEKPAPAGRK